MALTQALKDAQMWPIKAKGKVTRLNPHGDPKIESIYHKSLEQGRHLETSIGDANCLLAERKREVLARVQLLLDVNKVAVNAQPKRRLRQILLAANSIHFLKEVADFQKEITGLVQAIVQNIGLLQSMEQNMFRMVQANLNAISNLMHDICNWGLPDLPAIPNFFSDTIWNWNGFNFFPLAAFQPHIGFDKNFAFNQCVIHVPNINIFRNYPSTVSTYSDLQYGTPVFVPPLGGIIPNTGQNLSDPNFVAQMQQSNTDPVYGPDFNPNSSMLGSVPDPSTIINNYQMPSGTYRGNIVAIVPQTRVNTVEPGDTDYSNPNAVVRAPKLRADLVHFVTLQQVVASNFDPNLTAEWLFYLDNSRTGRGGVWIQNFQAAYNALVAPSVFYLDTTPIPWNNVLGGTGTQGGPTAIPFIDAVNAGANLNLLWKLSFVEAGLLGYTRTKDWDAGADPAYLDSFTQEDVDYRATTIDPTVTTTLVLGASTATFPTTCTFPSAISAMLQQVIDKAATDIANTPSFRSPHPQFRFTFNSFAQATEVDRFSQFWREFNANLQVLLVQDPFLVGFTVTYKESLDSATNPLGDPAIYDTLKADVATRSRTWTPGTPLLDIPVAPIVRFSDNSTPTDATNGWQGLDLDPVAFLARPDVQGQPIPVQIAMLRTNLSFAAISKFRDDMSAEFDLQIATAQTALATGNVGFQVEVVTDTPQSVPTGPGLTVAFDTIDFDITGNVDLPVPSSSFTLATGGSYAYAGNVQWDTGDVAVRTVTVFKNGNPIYTTSTDPVAGTSQEFSSLGQFLQGDVVTVVATHSAGSAQDILAGTEFSMIKMDDDPNAGGFPADNDNASLKVFTAAGTFPEATVVRIDDAGKVTPVDTTVVHFDSSFALTTITGDGANWTGTTGTAHGRSPGDTISIFGTVDFDGTYVLDTAAGTTFTILNTTNNGTTDSAGGQTIEGGNVVFPFADGITGFAAVTDNPVGVATSYGGIFQITSLSLTAGGLIFVGPNGLITQDYATLITQVQWILCVGRALTADTFLWEPHIPTRFNMTF